LEGRPARPRGLVEDLHLGFGQQSVGVVDPHVSIDSVELGRVARSGDPVEDVIDQARTCGVFFDVELVALRHSRRRYGARWVDGHCSSGRRRKADRFSGQSSADAPQEGLRRVGFSGKVSGARR
jgi:hypothetical protein